MREGKHWTQAELEYLCRFYAIDTASEIAADLGRSTNAVWCKVRELRKNNKFEYYRDLNEKWEEICIG